MHFLQTNGLVCNVKFLIYSLYVCACLELSICSPHSKQQTQIIQSFNRLELDDSCFQIFELLQSPAFIEDIGIIFGYFITCILKWPW